MRRTLVIVAVAVAAAVAACLASANAAHDFAAFERAHKKQYRSAAERASRFAIFEHNMKMAKALRATNPHATFGVNEFSDLSAAEFKATHHNAERFFALAKQQKRAVAAVPALDNMPQQVDWRAKGAVTAVKNQGQCGSCWAFSTTGGIEGQWFLAGNKLTSLSEQYFVSCDTIDSACNGGLPDNAFSWAIQAKGGVVVTENSYPYVSGAGQVPACQTAGLVFGAKIESYMDMPHNEGAMAAWSGANGPLSIGVAAGGSVWQTYTGGIVTNCVSTQVDHGVLIVGYDLTHSIPYWIVKNSWAASWGEQGYIRLQYGTNQCQITSAASTSIIHNSSVPTPAPTVPTPVPTAPPATPAPPPSPEPAGWVNLMPPGCDASCPGMMMGISSLGPRDTLVAGLVTGSGSDIGGQIFQFDNQVEGYFRRLHSPDGEPFMEMEMAVGGSPSAPRGVSCGLGLLSAPFSYAANASDFLRSAMPPGEFMSVVQGCASSPDGNYVIGADQSNNNQVFVSTNGGKNFSASKFPKHLQPQPGCTFPRYSAIGSEKIWYVTWGDWGSNNSAAKRSGPRATRDEFDITQLRKVVRGADGKVRHVRTSGNDLIKQHDDAAAAGEGSASGSGSNFCGNSAMITRTADGGKTWQSVYSSVDKFYFNEITCFSANHCIAVGEGFDLNPGVRILRTTDGVNWKQVFFMASSQAKSWSFFSVEVADAFSGEAWVGGSYTLPDQSGEAVFFHTTDGGLTWARFNHGIPSLMEVTQISFPPNSFGRYGFATAMTQFQDSTILRFDRTKVGPGPAPPQSYFTQSNCAIQGCLLCQSVQFPEYMCVQANGGGSVTAHCGKTHLVQTAYESTDCTGKGQESEVPLNKCISNQGQYFEFACPASSPRQLQGAVPAKKTDKVIVLRKQ